MKKNPLVSVITICYNEKKVVNTCNSIINQTFHNFEWVVVDGKSNDGTVDILKKYEKYMSVFISEKDEGIYDAMNKGIKNSRGEWIVFMNGGDCFYDSKSLENIFSRNCNADIIFADGINNVYNNKHPLPVNKSGDVSLYKFFTGNSFCHQATFIKKELFKKVGYYDISYKIIADHVFNYLAIKNYKVKSIYIPQIVALIDLTGVSMKNRVELDNELLRLRRENRSFFIEFLLFLRKVKVFSL